MGYRPIFGHIVFVEVLFFSRGMTEQDSHWSRKIPVLRDMFIWLLRHARPLIREVGMELRSHNVLDDWELIFDTSSLVTCEKKAKICRSASRRYVVIRVYKKTSIQCEVFDFFSEKKVANICECDWSMPWQWFAIKEGIDSDPAFARVGRIRRGQRSIEAFLSVNNCWMICVHGCTEEVELARWTNVEP